ncbi:MAG: hypothetical protein M3P38_03080 [Chloroflexota bacterium]|nr:hypothetical protein [Chloroflexota bacterium]
MVSRRNAVAAALAALVVGVVLGAVGASAWPRPLVTLPSPSPVPTLPAPTPTPIPTFTLLPTTPTPSPTIAPTPTVAPPPTRTKQPQPTTRVAGDRLLPYYFTARLTFPSMYPSPQIDFDFASDEDGDAFFRGLTPLGQPIFTVREDFFMTSRTAYHEIGHYYEALLNRKDASVDWRAKYWAFRGFPGTWQQAAAEAAVMTGSAQWIHQPQESWAEAFSIAMVGGGQEKTLDYGRTINPTATKAFFISLLN